MVPSLHVFPLKLCAHFSILRASRSAHFILNSVTQPIFLEECKNLILQFLRPPFTGFFSVQIFSSAHPHSLLFLQQARESSTSTQNNGQYHSVACFNQILHSHTMDRFSILRSARELGISAC